MTKLTIQLGELEHLSLESEKLVINPSTEDAVLKLVYLKLLTEKYLKHAKDVLAQQASEVMPNFKGFIGRYLKGTYRSYGAKYTVDLRDMPDPSFYTIKTSYSVDSKAVEDYLKEHGSLPQGIIENDRELQLTFNEKDLVEMFEGGHMLEDIDRLVLLDETTN